MRRQVIARWGRNVAIALVAAAIVNIAAGLVGHWGDAWQANPLAVLVVGTWIEFVYLFVMPGAVFLVGMEYVAPRARRPRRVATGAGAVLGFAYLLFLVTVTYGSIAATGSPMPVAVAACVFGLVGAAYGAVVALPNRRPAT